ncbi:MAG: hydrogenase maturation protease [Acidobacteria bacterium]|nr:hydrogenase maturation protease [Acidobacteriota bacterium]
MSTRIIGLGNSILTDDGIGIYAVREIRRRLEESGNDAAVDIVETEVGGFDLMELMSGWKRIILVDSIQFAGLEPGTVIRIQPDDLHTSLRLRSVHDIDLPTVLELGRRLGLAMPEEISIYGIQAEDALTLGERLTDAADRGMKEAIRLILEEIQTGTAMNCTKSPL